MSWREESHGRTTILGSLASLLRQSVLVAQILKGLDVGDIRDEAERKKSQTAESLACEAGCSPNGIAAAVQTTRSNHADVAHGIANLGNEAAEAIQIGFALKQECFRQ